MCWKPTIHNALGGPSKKLNRGLFRRTHSPESGRDIWQWQDYQVDSNNHCKRREECGGVHKTVFMYQYGTCVRTRLNRLSCFQLPWLSVLYRRSDQMCGMSIKCRNIGNSILFFLQIESIDDIRIICQSYCMDIL